MLTFLSPFFRFVPVSGLATFIDFSVSYLLFKYCHFSYPWATFTGNALGAVVGFFLSKYWVFKTSEAQNTKWQLVKYIIVSAGNSIMNTLGVWGVSKLIVTDYLIIRALVGTFVFVVYSYGMTKWFVFNPKKHEKVSI
jgi:putative flippase GtrA